MMATKFLSGSPVGICGFCFRASRVRASGLKEFRFRVDKARTVDRALIGLMG